MNSFRFNFLKMVLWGMMVCCAQMVRGEGYLLGEYEEPRVGGITSEQVAQWQKVPRGLNFSWASRDVHYRLYDVPETVPVQDTVVWGWKGERVNMMALIYSSVDQGVVTLRMTPWKRSGVQTTINAAKSTFVNYVVTDDYKSCGYHPMDLERWLVPDVIDNATSRYIPAMETRPIWCSVEIPYDIAEGSYTTELQALSSDGNLIGTLTLKINVLNRSLPAVAEQKFHLDLWQQPYSVSRYYGVERWSQEHIEALRPYISALAKAGQKSVTAIMFYEPWGEQTHDPDKFDPMVQTIRKKDGSWEYDYSDFDKYVELCAEYGITKQINCYSMVPWDMNFRYFDESTGDYVFLETKTSEPEYKELWISFLTSFKEHLQEREWFEKTNIAMDERSEKDMLNAFQIASELGFKVALAGNYHSSLALLLQDYCVAIGQDKLFATAELVQRKANNMVTTIYTSCADREPNIFSNSLPGEAAYLPIYAAAANIDGYLHWSWINWHENPLEDTRYRMFGAGDTYFYYPGNRSSVRFERLVEGIHQYEKIQILKEEFAGDSLRLSKLNGLLDEFKDSRIEGAMCAEAVNRMEKFLNGLDYPFENEENRQTVFCTTEGNGVRPPYRIPAIASTKDGRLIAVAARLVCGTDPGFGQIDLVSRVSDDLGKSWGEMQDIVVGSGRTSATENYFDTAFGDPAIVADKESDRVLILAVGGCTLYFDSKTNRSNPNLIAIIRSEDGGTTWSAPKDITEDIYSLYDKLVPMDAAFVTSGRIFQSSVVKEGEYYRLYAALCARPGGNRVIYSDDFGETWRPLGGRNALPVDEGNEALCEEFADGTLLISSRTSGGRIYNLFSYSNIAKGKGAWGEARKCDFADSGVKIGRNSTNGGVLVLNAKRVSDGRECAVMLQSVPFADGRSDVGIYYREVPQGLSSKDVAQIAQNWEGCFPVSTTTSAYSTMILQQDGRVAVLYEENFISFGKRANPISTTFPNGEGVHNFDGYDIVYVSFDLEKITSGKYTLR